MRSLLVTAATNASICFNLISEYFSFLCLNVRENALTVYTYALDTVADKDSRAQHAMQVMGNDFPSIIYWLQDNFQIYAENFKTSCFAIIRKHPIHDGLHQELESLPLLANQSATSVDYLHWHFGFQNARSTCAAAMQFMYDVTTEQFPGRTSWSTLDLDAVQEYLTDYCPQSFAQVVSMCPNPYENEQEALAFAQSQMGIWERMLQNPLFYGAPILITVFVLGGFYCLFHYDWFKEKNNKPDSWDLPTPGDD